MNEWRRKHYIKSAYHYLPTEEEKVMNVIFFHTHKALYCSPKPSCPMSFYFHNIHGLSAFLHMKYTSKHV